MKVHWGIANWKTFFGMWKHYFYMADTDNTGTLSEKEGRALRNYFEKPKIPEGSDLMFMFNYCDFNGDERMSEDELVVCMLYHGWDFGSIEKSVDRLHQFAGSEAGMNFSEYDKFMQSWEEKDHDDDQDEKHGDEDAVEIKV